MLSKKCLNKDKSDSAGVVKLLEGKSNEELEKIVKEVVDYVISRI